MEPKGQVRVAVVGSGMAGLVAAYLINQDVHSRYAVTLFEQGDKLSLDSASLSIPSHAKGCFDRVDLPMRAFAGGFYKNLIAMYNYLGVEYHVQPFLFDFVNAPKTHTGSTKRLKWSSYYVHSSNNHRIPPVTPKGIKTSAWLLETLYILVCYIWFSACCFLVLPRTSVEKDVCETLEGYLQRIKLPRYFVELYLLPMLSSVATCSHRALLDFPASDVTEYKRRTHGKPHYIVSNGVQDVQSKLAKGIDTRLSVTVSAVERQQSQVRISWRQTKNAHNEIEYEEVFDRVILAVSPMVVGKIFKPLHSEMAQIPVAVVNSTVHTDTNSIDELLGQPCFQQVDARKRGLLQNAAQKIYLRTSREGAHRTESIHVHPSGTLVTTCSLGPINPAQVIKSSRFVRVLRTPRSRRIINHIFSENKLVRDYITEKQGPS